MNEVNHKAATGPGPVLVTADQALTEQVVATGIALGTEILTLDSVDALAGQWQRAPVRLLGLDMVHAAEKLDPLPATWVLGREEPGLLAASARLKLPVLSLPEGSRQLARVLTTHNASPDQASIFEFVGASGGLGTSSLVAGLAARATASGVPGIAVELARFGGGLDLLFGVETKPGLRWSQLESADGNLGLQKDDLLTSGGAALLPLDRERPRLPPDSALSAVLGALGRSKSALVVDAGRERVAALPRNTRRVLLVGADITSVAAARMRIQEEPLFDASLVVRTGPGRSVPPGQIADALGLQLLGTVRHDPAVARLAESGESVASRKARRFTRDVKRIWTGLRP